VTEGAAIFASEEWCSDDHRKIYQNELAYQRPMRVFNNVQIPKSMTGRQEPNMIDVVRAEQAQAERDRIVIHAVALTGIEQRDVDGALTECGLLINAEPGSPMATGWGRRQREVVYGVTCEDCLIAIGVITRPTPRGIVDITINGEPYLPDRPINLGLPVPEEVPWLPGDVVLGEGVFARQPQTWDERDAEEVASATESRSEPPEGHTWEEVLTEALCQAVQDLQHCRQIFEDNGIDTGPLQHEIDQLAPVLLSVGHIHEVVEHEHEEHDHGPQPITEAEEHPPHVCNHLCHDDLHYTGTIEEPA
jgi:hypothetical protein